VITSRRRDPGFTLVEVLVAIVLVGILTAVVAIGVSGLTSKGSTAACAASADAARTAVAAQLSVTPVTDLNTVVAAGSLTLPSGTSLGTGGRTIQGSGWTMWFTPGVSPTFTCTSGATWTPALLPPGTAIWLDASNAASLTTSGGAVTTWRDLSGNSRDAANATVGAQPALAPSLMNGLPGALFDGTNDLLSFDGSFIANTSYTVSIVVQRASPKGYNAYLGGGVFYVQNINLVLGWRSDSSLMFAQWSNDLDTPTPAYTSPSPEIHVFRLDTTTGRQTWRNGSSLGTLANTAPLSGWSGAALGRYNGSFYDGAVGEMLITTTALSTTDRQKLEGYLAWKWGTQAQLPSNHPFRNAPPLAP
jgi:prepilin-type N-terminal cleavage/methylation domain-containing protein